MIITLIIAILAALFCCAVFIVATVEIISKGENNAIICAVSLICFCASLYGMISLIKDITFENNKETLYTKAEVMLLEKTDSQVRYLLDKTVVKEVSDMIWLKQDNIYKKSEFYKDRTNDTYIIYDEEIMGELK
jgi:hypothetical protein